MPSSIASLASGAGASAAAVASTSEANIASTRQRYGAQQLDQPAQLASAAAGLTQPPAQRRLIAAHSRSPPPPRAALRVMNTWSGIPFSTISRYSGELLQQLVVAALGRDPAILEHDDLVGERDRRQPVGDHERRPAGHHLAQRELDLLLGRCIDRRGRVVEDQDPRVRRAIARAIAIRWRWPPESVSPRSPIERVVAVGQVADERVRLSRPRRRLDLLAGRVGPSVGDVLVHRRREQERIVVDDSRSRGAGSRGRRSGRRRRRSIPRPSVTSYSRGSSETSAVLPEPIAPTSATVCPASTSRSMSARAGCRAPSNVSPTPLEPHAAAAGRQCGRRLRAS